MKNKIQSVYAFSYDGWDEYNLLDWIKDNGLKPIKNAHYSGDAIRYRIKEPNVKKKYITKIVDDGIHLVIEI